MAPEASATEGRQVGRGDPVSFPQTEQVEGTLAVVRELGDSLALLERSEDELRATLLWVPEPVVTLVAPVLESVGAVLCAAGGPAAHVAIVSRGLGLPCLMQCAIEGVEELDGERLTVRSDGTVWAAADA